MPKNTASLELQVKKQWPNNNETLSIDDIFAAPKTKRPKAGATSVIVVTESEKKKKNKRKAEEPVTSTSKDAVVAPEDGSNKKRVASFDQREGVGYKRDKVKEVDTVVDLSTVNAAAPKSAVTKKAKKGSKIDRKEEEDDEVFKDSRGTGPRRQTEEGYLIFKEAELGIDPEAGGTPLCRQDTLLHTSKLLPIPSPSHAVILIDLERQLVHIFDILTIPHTYCFTLFTLHNYFAPLLPSMTHVPVCQLI
nr:hypothetical protein L204_02803 [Cryptococcus depauperatus CBS 7855]